jgi:hypothetical protein
LLPLLLWLKVVVLHRLVFLFVPLRLVLPRPFSS